jgi:lipoprotein-anchoring transpeptidase ErfK/SrfK
VPDSRDERLSAAFQRQAVFYRTNEPVGTIIIDTVYRYLYLVQEQNRAIRYGIAVGREGFEWEGLLRVTRKVEWPDWAPSPDLIRRQPQLPRSMKGGPGNPFGARALHLGATYRVHGTNQPRTIGGTVVDGCFRLANPDVIDLYARVAVGTKVVVRQKPSL